MPNGYPNKGKGGEATFTFTSTGSIISAGSRLCERLKKTPEELIHNELSSFMTQYSAEITMLFAGNVLKLGKSRQFEVTLLNRGGKILPAMLHLDRKQENGETYLQASISSFSGSPTIRDQAIQTEKMAAIGILAAGLAYEIGVPTSHLQEHIPRIKEAFDDILPILEKTYESNKDLEIAKLSYPAFKREIDEIIAGLQSGTERITKTVDYFRGLSFDGKNRRKETIDLGQILRTCIQLTKSLRKDNDIGLELIIDGSVSGIRGNAEQLRYIFLNILFKAHAFLAGKPGEISVTAGRDSSTDYIRVEIEASIAKQKDYKNSRRIDETALSLNLGLGSIQKLLKPFNGRFGMRSVRKGGTMFLIEIPTSVPELRKKQEEPVTTSLS